jgi:hypothetical protein
MRTKQFLLICLLIALSVLVIDVLDRRSEIPGKAGARAKIGQLAPLAAKENNGRIPKAEFMKFMSEEFDRIDSDRSGSLTPEQLSHSILIRGRDVQPSGEGR